MEGRDICAEIVRRTLRWERRNKYSIDVRVKIIRSYINGVGFRQISRIFEIPLTITFDFIKRKGGKLDKIMKEKAREKILEKEIVDLFHNLFLEKNSRRFEGEERTLHQVNFAPQTKSNNEF